MDCVYNCDAATYPLGKRGKGVGVRALDCSCGQHLEADNDEELFERAREHVDADHPGMELATRKCVISWIGGPTRSRVQINHRLC